MNESSILGVSVRALLATVIILSFCGLAIALKDIIALKDLALMALGYFFAKQTQGGSNASNSTGSGSASASGPAS